MVTPHIHGTLIVIGEKGVLITGASGTGKSTLALKLLAACQAAGTFARLVSDDQVLLEGHSDRLIGSAPAAIAGLVEVWGIGPTRIAHEKAGGIDLVVQLVPQDKAPRMNEETVMVLEGVRLPVVQLAERNVEGSVLAIMALLSQGPFASG